MKKKKNVPALRFPEFDEIWIERILRKCVTKVGSGVTPKGGAESYKSFGVPLIRSQNVKDNVLDFSDIAFIDPRTHQNMSSTKTRDEDILLNITGASIGRSCVIPRGMPEANVNQHVCIIRLAAEFSPWFLQCMISSNIGQKLIQKSQGGSGREGLTFENINNFRFSFPALPEQRKIAAFLSSVDEKITQLERKKALLERYKKGVMQKLFSQQIRFKDEKGKKFPDWEEKKISEVFEVTRGFVLAIPEISRAQSDVFKYPVYSSQTKDNGLAGYFTKFIFENAITWTTDGANAGDVKFRAGKFYCTNVCGVLLSTKGFANQCIAEMLNTVTHKYVSYVGNPKLMNNVMGMIKLSFPHPAEQRKIASFLSALDDKIALVSQQIDGARKFKKALLQHMFV